MNVVKYVSDMIEHFIKGKNAKLKGRGEEVKVEGKTSKYLINGKCIMTYDLESGILTINPNHEISKLRGKVLTALFRVRDVLKEFGIHISWITYKNDFIVTLEKDGKMENVIISPKSVVKIKIRETYVPQLIEGEEAIVEKVWMLPKGMILLDEDGKAEWVRINAKDGYYWLNVKSGKIYKEYIWDGDVNIIYLIETKDVKALETIKNYVTKNTWIVVDLI